MSDKDFLTKYECSRIIGLRASQISMGAPIFVEIPNNYKNALYIAAMELKKGMLDMVICRPLPNNCFYKINIKDLEVPDDVDTFIEMLNK